MSSAPPATTSPILPLQTPFWFSSGTTPCAAQIVDNAVPASASQATYCCDGLLIDIHQPIIGTNLANNGAFYLQDLRCCSGDADVALGSVTTCSVGSEASLALSVSLSSSAAASGSGGSGVTGAAASSTAETVTTTAEMATNTAASASATKTGTGNAPRRRNATIYSCVYLAVTILASY